MGYGFGFPLFNYYPPLPYLVGELVRVLGFSFTSVAKLNFAMAIILSGIAMYLLAKEFFGRFGGALSAIFYIWAPYHALDIYVRGAMNESWALVFFPFIFWTGYKLITVHRSRFTILLALSWAGLLLTHNLMVLIFAPVFLIWCLLFLLRKENRKNIFRLIIRLFTAGLLALGLSAFFTLPAFFEQKYVHIGSLVSDYYEYFAHYVSIKQLLISRFWGDGPSTFGINDGMAFPVGHFHWILSLIILVVLTVLFLRKKLNSKLHTTYYILLFFILVGWFSAFMAHER